MAPTDPTSATLSVHPGRLRLGLRGSIVTLAALGALACASRPPAAPPPTPFSPPVILSEASDPDFRIDPALREFLREAPDDGRLRVLVDLTEQVDLARLTESLRAAGRGKLHRRGAVIGALERVAERQQARLRPEIDRLLEAGSLDYVRPVAVVNRLLVEGSAAGIRALAESPEVAHIAEEWSSVGSTRRSDTTSPPPASEDGFTSWAIAALGADRLWARGYTGRGVVVAAIDTGAYGEHEQLRGRNLGGSRGWFDPVQGLDAAYDNHGHGTGVLSVAVGGNPEGRAVGIAPASRWAVALGNWRNHYSTWRMTEAADWVLRIARPDVLVNAWSHDEGECSDFDLAFINAWKAAEIFVVFPAGNAGPRSATAETPASLAGTLPAGGPVFSVAAVVPGDGVHPESSRGPSRCGSPSFPTLSAPGGDIPYASTGGPAAYVTASGTSLAAGLVAGAAALLLQADPDLTPDRLEKILIETARDLPPPGRDDATGAGMLDLPAALDRVLAGDAAP